MQTVEFIIIIYNVPINNIVKIKNRQIKQMLM